MITRSEVFSAINGERDHQDKKWGSIGDHPHEVGSWILIMESLLADARKAWQSATGDRDALDEIRKVAGTAVACMEQHGVPTRSEMLKLKDDERLRRKLDKQFRELGR